MKKFGLFISLFILIGMLMVQTQPIVLAQTQARIVGKGEVCASGRCFPIEVSFPPAGGMVSGTVSGSYNVPNPPSTDCVLRLSGTMDGTFAGGDGGSVAGNLNFTQNFTCANGSNTSTWNGTWKGTLLASGSGSGSFSASGSSGTWTLYYSAAEFQNALAPKIITPSITPTIITVTPVPQVVEPVPPAAPAAPAVPAAPAAPADGAAAQPDVDWTLIVKQQIDRMLQNNSQSEKDEPAPLTIVPFAGNRLLNLSMDADGQPFVTDEQGNKVSLDMDGTPLEDVSGLGSFFSNIQEMINQIPQKDLVDYLIELQLKLPAAYAPLLDPAMDYLVRNDGVSGVLEKLASTAQLQEALKNISGLEAGDTEKTLQIYQQIAKQLVSYNENIHVSAQSKLYLSADIHRLGVDGLIQKWQLLKNDLIRIRSNIETIKPELVEEIDQVLSNPEFQSNIPVDADFYRLMGRISNDQYDYWKEGQVTKLGARGDLDRELGKLNVEDAIDLLASNNLIPPEKVELYKTRFFKGVETLTDIRLIHKQMKTLQSILPSQQPPPAGPTGIPFIDGLIAWRVRSSLGITIAEGSGN